MFMSVGSAEHVRSRPSGVRIDGLASKAGVLGATLFDEPAELGEEAAGVAGGGIGDEPGADRLGGDGVSTRDVMVAGWVGQWILRRCVVGAVR
jgi:hypothetical protein